MVILDPFCRMRYSLRFRRASGPPVGAESTSPRKRPTLCRSASVRKSTCFTTSSRFADPTFQDGRTLANCPATGHTNTSYSASKKGHCAEVARCSFQFRNFTVDHLTPQSQGGTDHMDNLQLLCGACNSMKGTGTQAELIVKLQAQELR